MRGRAEAARPESERIGLLLRRDGHELARSWVERTVRIYETAILDSHGHASDPFYRPLFERAIEEFRAWLREDLSGTEFAQDDADRAAPIGTRLDQ
ncbi:MAG: hypothetical protein ACRET0_04535 [Steroidobacteraceae bacterium]